MTNNSYSIYPRYTAGSPAGVSEETCRRVLAEEVDAIKFILMGYQGPEKKAEAEAKGLEGIAIEQWETHGTIYLKDLFSNKVTTRKTTQPTIVDRRSKVADRRYKIVTDEEILAQIDKWWNRLGQEKRMTPTEVLQVQRLLFNIKQALLRNKPEGE